MLAVFALVFVVVPIVEITVALTAIAEADAAVKGAGVDPAYALERAVLTVTAARAAS